MRRFSSSLSFSASRCIASTSRLSFSAASASSSSSSSPPRHSRPRIPLRDPGETSGGIKFSPSSIGALDAMHRRGNPIMGAAGGRYAKAVQPVTTTSFADDADELERQQSHDHIASSLIVDSAAPRILRPGREDRTERARRLRQYRPVTLEMREKIAADSPHKTYHRITPDAGFGERVDDFLRAKFPDFSYDTFRRLVEAGHIYRYRDGRKVHCRLTDRLTNGEYLVIPTREHFFPGGGQQEGGGRGGGGVAIAPPAGDVYESLRTGSGQAARDMRLADEQRKAVHLSYRARQEAHDWVLFKNEYVIAINKPSGVPVTRTDDGTLNVSDLLPAWKFTLTHRPLICNFLDKETSGIVLLARTHDTHRMLGKMFQKRVVPNSVYWGFCVGTPKAVTGRIKMHLETVRAPKKDGRDKNNASYTVARTTATPDSRVAISEFVVNASAAEYASFLSFYPLTSRTHQLRIMAAHGLRCPLVGDAKFGGENAFPENLDALLGNPTGDETSRKATKMHLHFRKLQLPYKKRNGEFECVSAPVPSHMKETFARLGWSSNVDDPLIPG